MPPAGPDRADLQRRVVLAIRTTCPACSASERFYRELSLAVRAWSYSGGLIVLSPDPSTTISEWLAARSIEVDQVISGIDLYSIGVLATPTLLLVDERGYITDLLASRLTTEEEGDLFRRLRGVGSPLNNTRYAQVVGEAELATLAGSGSVAVIDVRDVLRRFCLGDGLRAIARGSGSDRKTVAKYVAAAIAAGLRRGDPAPTDEQVAAVIAAVRAAPVGRPGDVPARLAPHRDRIAAWLAEGCA